MVCYFQKKKYNYRFDYYGWYFLASIWIPKSYDIYIVICLSDKSWLEAKVESKVCEIVSAFSKFKFILSILDSR